MVESEPTPLHQVLGPELGQLFADLHSEHAVGSTSGAAHRRSSGQDGVVLAARTDDGEEHPAHDVLAAIGAAPRTMLAEGAGLDMAARAEGGGIAVDASLRTSDLDIFAAGDVASFPLPGGGAEGGRIRVEHWANALNRRARGPGDARPGAVDDRVPYFFTDQYDLGMEYSGYVEPDGYDEVVFRGDRDGGEFIAFWLKDDRVLAGMNVNVWDVTDAIQALIRSGARLDPDALANPAVPLGSIGG